MCDRGQRYCLGACARAARRRSLREANRRYQRTPRGRHMSAERSRRYRDRRRVTDQGEVRALGHDPEATTHRKPA